MCQGDGPVNRSGPFFTTPLRFQPGPFVSSTGPRALPTADRNDACAGEMEGKVVREIAEQFVLEDVAPRHGGTAIVFAARDKKDNYARVAVKVFDPPPNIDPRIVNDLFS